MKNNHSRRLLRPAAGVLLALPLAACAPQGGATTTTGAPRAGATATTIAGSPTGQLPSDIPAYPGAQYLSSQTQGTLTIYLFTTNDSVAQVLTFYQQEMPQDGWTPAREPVPALDPLGEYTKGQRHAHIEARSTGTPISATNPGPTMIMISVSG